jgi:hypothetical protein
MSDNEDITAAINTDNNTTIAENAAPPSITNLQQTDNFRQPNTSPYDDKSKSNSNEEDNPVDVAVITALTNLRNCLRRGAFTKQSIFNFKQKNPSLVKALISDGADVTEVKDWIILFSDKITILDEVSQSSCINLLLSIKVTYPQFPFPDN